MSDGDFLGDIGLVLIGIVLAVTLIPLLIGISVAFLCGISGLLFYGIVILIACIIWACMGVIYYV